MRGVLEREKQADIALANGQPLSEVLKLGGEMSERITIGEISDALSYAATALQVEITDATVAVYFDQLRRCEAGEIVRAVKKWVSNYNEPYRQLPTVGELRATMREGIRPCYGIC